MSEDKLNAASKELAQQLTNSNKKIHSASYTITDSDEAIVIIAVEVPQRRKDETKRIMTKMATQPIGSPCPKCNGSGTI